MALGSGNTLGLVFRISADGTAKTKAEVAELRASFQRDVAAIKGSGNDAFTSLGKSIGLSSEQMAGLATAAPIAGAAILGIAAAATAAAVGLFELVKKTADFEGKLFDLSTKTNFAVETLSALQVAAQNSGSTLESLTPSLVIFQKNMEKASEGQALMSKLFKANNVDMRDNEKGLRDVFKALGNMETGSKQTATAMQFFGRSGKDVLGVIKETNGDLDKAMAKYEALGLIVSSKAAKAADEFGDTLKIVELQMASLGREIGDDLMPTFLTALQSISKAVVDNKQNINDWTHSIEDAASGTVILATKVLQLTAAIIGLQNVPIPATLRVLAMIATGGVSEGIAGLFTGAAAVGRAAHTPDFSDVGEGLFKPKAGGGAGEGAGGAAKAVKAVKDELAPFRAILDQVNRSLDFFGEKTERAKVEQEFLQKGIEKLTGNLREKADALRGLALLEADSIDNAKKAAAATALLAAEEKKLREVSTEVELAINKQGQQLADLQSNFPSYTRTALDFIGAKLKEGFTWDENTKSIYLYRAAMLALIPVIREQEQALADALVANTPQIEGVGGKSITDQIGEPPPLSHWQTFAGGMKKAMGDSANAVKGFSASVSTMGEMAISAIGALGNAVGNMVQQWVLMGSAADLSFRKIVATVLAGVSAQAASLAVMSLAYAALATTAVGAAMLGGTPAQFLVAAELFGAVALVTGVAGRLVAGDSFSKSSGASAGAGASSGTGASSSANAGPTTINAERNKITLEVVLRHDPAGGFDGAVAKSVIKGIKSNGPIRSLILSEAR